MTALARSVPRVLAVAGSDPSGGAGIQADLKSIAANGGYGMAALTALTAQNTRGVSGVHVPPAAFVRAQLDAVASDIRIDGVKIGMLANAEVTAAVRGWLEAHRPPIVVLDPVMVATSGDRLLDARAEAALHELLPLADLVTPNVPELAVLAGEEPALTHDALIGQAAAVSGACGALVLAKGGHMDADDVRDVLVDGRAGVLDSFSHPRLRTATTHGTGCSLSSAIATLRAGGSDWGEATGEAVRWLTGAIARGAELGVGRGNGPVHHFAELWDTARTAQ